MTMRPPENFRGHIAPPPQLVRWCKFNLVGGIGIGVQFAALLLVKGVLHFNYMAATAIAVEAAVVHNFVWHEQFTWADRTMMPKRSDRTVPPPPSQAAAEQSAERRGVGCLEVHDECLLKQTEAVAQQSQRINGRATNPQGSTLLCFDLHAGSANCAIT